MDYFNLNAELTDFIHPYAIVYLFIDGVVATPLPKRNSQFIPQPFQNQSNSFRGLFLLSRMKKYLSKVIVIINQDNIYRISYMVYFLSIYL